MAQPMLPDVRRWELIDRDRKSKTFGEKRVYEQSELVIDGEAALFGLIARQTIRLRDVGFPFDQLGKTIVDPDKDPETGQDVPGTGGIQIDMVGALLAQATAVLPGLVSEAAAILFGIFPSDENGKRNADFVGEVAFLRGAVGFAEAIEMLETFIDQNDIERLRAPFVRATSLIRSLAASSAAGPTGPTTEATSPTTEPSISSSAPDTGGPGRLPDGTRGAPSTAR